MITHAKHDYSQVDVIGRQIRVHCMEFGRNPRDIPKSHSTLHRIRQLIEFIPMASDDFGVAVSRINNAFRYCESAEFGAAQYEIRLFLGVLSQSLGPVVQDITGPQTGPELLNSSGSIFGEGVSARVTVRV